LTTADTVAVDTCALFATSRIVAIHHLAKRFAGKLLQKMQFVQLLCRKYLHDQQKSRMLAKRLASVR
jgi:hypothetical protein